jgi:hypothetical protein
MIPSAPSVDAFVRRALGLRECPRCPERTYRDTCQRCLIVLGETVPTYPVAQKAPQQQRGHEAQPITARHGASPFTPQAVPGTRGSTSARRAGGRALSCRPVVHRVGSIGGRAR